MQKDLTLPTEVHIRESYAVKALSCFVGFEGKNLRIVVLNDAVPPTPNKVFDMNCCRDSKEKILADCDTLKTEIWCQMPKGGKVTVTFGKDHQGKKLRRDKKFEETLTTFLRREIKRHTDFESHGARKTPYQIKFVA